VRILHAGECFVSVSVHRGQAMRRSGSLRLAESSSETESLPRSWRRLDRTYHVRKLGQAAGSRSCWGMFQSVRTIFDNRVAPSAPRRGNAHVTLVTEGQLSASPFNLSDRFEQKDRSELISAWRRSWRTILLTVMESSAICTRSL
jgi:hypothetical protein